MAESDVRNIVTRPALRAALEILVGKLPEPDEARKTWGSVTTDNFDEIRAGDIVGTSLVVAKREKTLGLVEQGLPDGFIFFTYARVGGKIKEYNLTIVPAGERLTKIEDKYLHTESGYFDYIKETLDEEGNPMTLPEMAYKAYMASRSETLTQAEYDALKTKDSDTTYYIVES